jgi:hypothetical protein
MNAAVTLTGLHIKPRQGESLTAAVIRELDPRAGSGLSETDRMCINAENRAADQKTISELRDSLASANETIAELQNQLDHARVGCRMWAELAG